MFKNKRFITKGYQNKIPIEIQILLFQLIDSLEEESEMDYLQVFELSIANNKLQKVEHRMEVPTYHKEYFIEIDNPVNNKVFIIDDGFCTTAMLSEEY